MAGGTVLVVEDDQAIAELIQILLADSGYKIAVAARGEEGLELAREQRPDIITLDIALPDIDGHEVLRRLRGDPELSSIPVIVISARRFRARPGENVAGVLPKPFDATELDALLKRMLPPVSAP